MSRVWPAEDLPLDSAQSAAGDRLGAPAKAAEALRLRKERLRSFKNDIHNLYNFVFVCPCFLPRSLNWAIDEQYHQRPSEFGGTDRSWCLFCNSMDGSIIESLSTVRTASWNIAAINNNPFEYWITYPDPAYNTLMHDFERILSDPKNDFRIRSVFTNKMFQELKSEMQVQNVCGLEELEGIWSRDFSRRLAIKEFLQDSSIGDKRLTSMPDRITNTINLHDGTILLRPTPINAFNEPLGTVCNWWPKWIKFMFHTDVCLCSNDEGISPTLQRVFTLISPIRRSKYPAITTAEQEISIPLQILCLAILDSIFLNVLNLAAPSMWESIRGEICRALIGGKELGVCRIIGEAYRDIDVFFVQVLLTHLDMLAD